jgi:hypothetical protein
MVGFDALLDADGEMHSPFGLSFNDFAYMQIGNKRTVVHRRKPIPVYATDHDAMRRLVVRHLELRAFTGELVVKKGPMPGTDAYRLRRAHIKLMDDVPRLDALATNLCCRYVEGKANGMSAAELRQLEIEIEAIDTQLRMSKNAPEIIVGVLYRSYCCHEDSVTVAERFGLKPPAIRQLLWRLAKTWNRMQEENAPQRACGRLPKTTLARLEQCRKKSSTWYASLTEEERKARMDRNVARRRAHKAAARVTAL